MNIRSTGCTQEVAAAKSGMSERSGRRIEGAGGQRKKSERHWRTRPDPLLAAWKEVLVPMLEVNPALQATTLLAHLQSTDDSGTYPDNLLRTIQRRIKHWLATQGPDKAVIFRQHHDPGRQGLSDFTKLKRVQITIKGEALAHLLYHFRLAYSGWSHMKVVLGGESFTALAQGLQEALWRLGGAPCEHRTDSLSAAFKNLSSSDQEDITDRYEQLCGHYGMKATRNNRGIGHENGSIEAPHGHLKRRIEQALMLRGSNDFDGIESYQQWLDSVVNKHNRCHAQALTVERGALKPLPLRKSCDYTEACARVSSSSTMDVRRVTYSVPPRLIGEYLRIHLYHDRLDCFVGRESVYTMKRLYAPKGTPRVRNIDYRHLIGALIKKPQAFRYSQLRDNILPSTSWQTIWEWVDANHTAKAACKLIVGLLHLAAQNDAQESLACQLMHAIKQGGPLVLSDWVARYRQPTLPLPDIEVAQHALGHYDALLTLQQRAVHHG